MLSRKNISLIAGLVLVVCLAVYINWRYSDTVESGLLTPEERQAEEYGEAEFVNSSKSGYFEQARLTRQVTRDDAIEQLESIVENESAAQKAKDDALSVIAAYAKYTETEGRIENLIKAKGFEECVVIISSDSVSVVIKSKDLTEDAAAKITDIVVQEAGVRAAQLRIIDVE